MELQWVAYESQDWPAEGRHVLAQYDDETVVVYQAYRPAIAEHAVAHQAFGGPWKLDRTSWIKPNFLWMTYRCGWATKPDQERVLAIWLDRGAFDGILGRAVESRHRPDVTGWTEEEWRREGRRSGVRMQWDPDHSPTGHPVERRAIQLGLRGEVLRRFATEWIRAIVDITDEVRVQHSSAHPSRYAELRTPLERVYRPADDAIARRIRLSPWTGSEPS